MEPSSDENTGSEDHLKAPGSHEDVVAEKATTKQAVVGDHEMKPEGLTKVE